MPNPNNKKGVTFAPDEELNQIKEFDKDVDLVSIKAKPKINLEVKPILKSYVAPIIDNKKLNQINKSEASENEKTLTKEKSWWKKLLSNFSSPGKEQKLNKLNEYIIKNKDMSKIKQLVDEIRQLGAYTTINQVNLAQNTNNLKEGDEEKAYSLEEKSLKVSEYLINNLNDKDKVIVKQQQLTQYLKQGKNPQDAIKVIGEIKNLGKKTMLEQIYLVSQKESPQVFAQVYSNLSQKDRIDYLTVEKQEKASKALKVRKTLSRNSGLVPCNIPMNNSTYTAKKDARRTAFPS